MELMVYTSFVLVPPFQNESSRPPDTEATAISVVFVRRTLPNNVHPLPGSYVDFDFLVHSH